jgi:hypothetical protein
VPLALSFESSSGPIHTADLGTALAERLPFQANPEDFRPFQELGLTLVEIWDRAPSLHMDAT